jgi:hypothetical protein
MCEGHRVVQATNQVCLDEPIPYVVRPAILTDGAVVQNWTA